MASPLYDCSVENIAVSITTFNLSVGMEHSAPSVVISGNAATFQAVSEQKKRTRFDLTISPYGRRLDTSQPVSEAPDVASAICMALQQFLRTSDVVPERYRMGLLQKLGE